MKVLLMHNQYRSGMPSGENVAVAREIDELEASGLDVVTDFRRSDDLQLDSRVARLLRALGTLRGAGTLREVGKLVEEISPNVVHLHNPLPLYPVSVISRIQDIGIPVIHTVHNYRMQCLVGTSFRDGAVCHDCYGRSPVRGVLHRCAHDGLPASAFMAVATRQHLDAWLAADRFVAPSTHVSKFLEGLGVDERKILVRPSGVPMEVHEAQQLTSAFLFAGRLDVAKGFDLLLQAWAAAELDAHLTIVGDGPLRDRALQAAEEDSRIEFLGRLESGHLALVMAQSGVVVVPSRVEETFGVVASEALAAGRPVLATNRGALEETVGRAGWIVDPTVAQLAQGLRRSLIEAQTSDWSGRVRGQFETLRRAASVDRLLGLYEEVATR